MQHEPTQPTTYDGVKNILYALHNTYFLYMALKEHGAHKIIWPGVFRETHSLKLN